METNTELPRIRSKIDNPQVLWRPNLRDEKYYMFIELAVASESTFLITNNVKNLFDLP
jgi:predicted nucleic acid-binding protein